MNTQTKKSEYRTWQLEVDDVLTDKQYKMIAELIYETDPFIYPAIFESNRDSRETAIALLPGLLRSAQDNMFRQDNLFLYMKGDCVVGIILWNKGPLCWDYIPLVNVAKTNGFTLKEENLVKVRDKYVQGQYFEADPDTISLINICINSTMRGQGVGKRMMTEFLLHHEGEQMELCVLSDNLSALTLYQNMGFEITAEVEGFSITDEKPRCFEMKRA